MMTTFLVLAAIFPLSGKQHVLQLRRFGFQPGFFLKQPIFFLKQPGFLIKHCF